MNARHPNPVKNTPPASGASPLVSVPAGKQVKIAGFTPESSEDLRERLLAYGLIPGQVIRVQAQRPVTVVVIEHTELALERVLAQRVLVELLA